MLNRNERGITCLKLNGTTGRHDLGDSCALPPFSLRFSHKLCLNSLLDYVKIPPSSALDERQPGGVSPELCSILNAVIQLHPWIKWSLNLNYVPLPLFHARPDTHPSSLKHTVNIGASHCDNVFYLL